jgi:hypothetical protein
MKKIILTAYMACISLFTIAQKPDEAISFLPQKANNILIMNSSKYSTVKTWEVMIQTKRTNGAYITERTFNIEDSYYAAIAQSYMAPGYFIKVRGLDMNGTVVTEQGPLAIDPNAVVNDPIKVWQCIGKTYAYTLKLFATSEGSSYIQMDMATPPASYPYPHYYQWISGDSWEAFRNQQSPNYNSPAYYGISGTLFDDSQGFVGDQIIHTTLTTTVLDANNNPISGNVYGVQKFTGPWHDTYSMIASNQIASGNPGYQNFGWAMQTVNGGDIFDAPSTIPPLTCNGVSGDGSTGPPSGGTSDAELYEPCLDFYAEGWTSSTVTANVNNMVTYIIGCSRGNNSGTGGGRTVLPYAWPEDISSITLKDYNSNDLDGAIVLSEANTFDANGNYIGTPVTINKGLYLMNVMYTDGSHGRAFFESQEISTSPALSKSDFLSATVFPVPITGNAFSLRLNATATVDFTYTLRDVNGIKLFERSYSMSRDELLTDQVDVRGEIPSGVLFNKVVFSDGSEINFQTVK